MLSKEEKAKIELEEEFRDEISQKFKTKSKIDSIHTLIRIIQGIAIVFGIVFTYLTYKKQINDSNRQSQQEIEQTAKEFRKTFYENQFKYYSEAIEATSIVATEKFGSEDYKDAKKKFYRLYWGRLSMVEDKSVEATMIAFETDLDDYEGNTNKKMKDSLQNILKQASYALAHASRDYTINVWLDGHEQKNYNDIESYKR